MKTIVIKSTDKKLESRTGTQLKPVTDVLFFSETHSNRKGEVNDTRKQNSNS